MYAVKEILMTFLHMDVRETDFSPIIVQHPIFECGLHCYEGKDYSIFEQNGLRKITDMYEQRIQKCSTPEDCMYIMRKAYYLTFLKYAKPYISRHDFSNLLAVAWMASENPNSDVNVSLKELQRWFTSAEKNILMTESELQTYSSLPDIIHVYRGVGVKSCENGMSWTNDKEKAVWFANRFSAGYLLQGAAQKKDVLAFFNRRNENEFIIPADSIAEKVKVS